LAVFFCEISDFLKWNPWFQVVVLFWLNSQLLPLDVLFRLDFMDFWLDRNLNLGCDRSAADWHFFQTANLRQGKQVWLWVF
jgi:hypothetical protein